MVSIWVIDEIIVEKWLRITKLINFLTIYILKIIDSVLSIYISFI